MRHARIEAREGEDWGGVTLFYGGARAPAASVFLAYLRPTEHFWFREQCYFSQFLR